MTAIVGYIDGKDVWMGGDSASTSSDLAQDVTADHKVFQNDSMLFGYCGSWRMGQLLEFAFKPPMRRPKSTAPMRYMATTFVNAMRECFKTAGFASKESGHHHGLADQEIMDGEFLVAYEGRLYAVYGDYTVAESRLPFNAVGCGAALALGAMFAMHNAKEIIRAPEQIKRALAAAARFNAGVRPPFVIKRLEPPK